MSRRKNLRREHARAEVDWPVTFTCGKATLKGRMKNLSRGGAFLCLEKNFELHEQIRLAIEIREFEDVISAKAEVVRTSSVIPDKNATSFAVAVKFTEISNEDLRYFTSNLAHDWWEYHEEPNISTTRRSSVKSIGLVFSIFILISITFYVLQLNNNFHIEEKKVEQLRNDIKVMQDQIVAMQSSFLTFATVEKLQYETDYFEEQFDLIYYLVKPLIETENIPTSSNTIKAGMSDYSVKESDNLYRIGPKHSINVNKIDILNSMSQDESIYPGQ